MEALGWEGGLVVCGMVVCDRGGVYVEQVTDLQRPTSFSPHIVWSSSLEISGFFSFSTFCPLM